MQLTRRGLIGGISAFSLLGNGRIEPEIILHNARIWTVDPAAPEAEAIAIARGRILAIGKNDFVLNGATASTRKINVGGQRITPGFIDAHAHPAEIGVSYVRRVACDLNSISEIKVAIAARAASIAPGEWIEGFMYDDGKTERPLSVRDLDDAAPRNPVIVTHRGGHSSFVNSLALRFTGYERNTPNPPNGYIERDANGDFTGKLGDAARDPIRKLLPINFSREEYSAGAKYVSRKAAARGITAVCDAGGSMEALQAYRDNAYAAGPPPVRIYCHIRAAKIDAFLASGVATGFGDERVRLGAVKFMTDGSISERTAWMSEPYVGTDFHGTKIGTRDELLANVLKVHEAGWQVGIHANGDLAISETLDVFEEVQKRSPLKDPRFRIEHCTVVNRDLIARMARLRVIPVPFASYVYFHGDVMHHYGTDRLNHMFAMRDMLDAGLVVPSSSDFSASPMDPPMWLQAQVTRTDPRGRVWGPDQRITLVEAIRSGTINGAYAQFDEHRLGSLAPGKLADLVVWKSDPFDTDPSHLAALQPERTMIGGVWAFES